MPAFRVKIDAVPGLITKVWATPTRIGTYAVICNELCGIGHSQMRSIVNVVTPARFRQWIAQQKQAAKRAAVLRERPGRCQGGVHPELLLLPHAGRRRGHRHRRAEPGQPGR